MHTTDSRHGLPVTPNVLARDFNPPNTPVWTTSEPLPPAASNAAWVAKDNCRGNAVVQSFFSTLKAELVHAMDFLMRESAKAVLVEFIDALYNRKWRHSSLGYISPTEFEKAASQVALAA
ncbi:IS5 family transposase orfB [Corallococcus coralloides]|uniref:IS5 family transposase orfB n=1 Tax=Corallococcus coralloides TaxID=184914 RepID=A0A410RZ44_CORCK|nr:IS5 family transposase orfB [Corallococcus coralloides]